MPSSIFSSKTNQLHFKVAITLYSWSITQIQQSKTQWLLMEPKPRVQMWFSTSINPSLQWLITNLWLELTISLNFWKNRVKHLVLQLLMSTQYLNSIHLNLIIHLTSSKTWSLKIVLLPLSSPTISLVTIFRIIFKVVPVCWIIIRADSLKYMMNRKQSTLTINSCKSMILTHIHIESSKVVGGFSQCCSCNLSWSRISTLT